MSNIVRTKQIEICAYVKNQTLTGPRKHVTIYDNRYRGKNTKSVILTFLFINMFLKTFT